jgi:hypothetical protein|tara:strand:+ start:1644 stop:2051 length:408 start_codon:yes stop_codon:yes gene_type:complete
MDMNMEMSPADLSLFKSQVSEWLMIDQEILKHENKIKGLKKTKKKILEPKITSFMVQHNISDLNTDNGKIRCNETSRKMPLNKTNIRDNLSQVMVDSSQIEQAMQLIMNNRVVVKSHILTKPKTKDKNTINATSS